MRYMSTFSGENDVQCVVEYAGQEDMTGLLRVLFIDQSHFNKLAHAVVNLKIGKISWIL